MKRGSRLLMSPKHEIRRQLIEKRLDISPHRRNIARKEILEKLLPRLSNFSYILSFASKEEEIDLWPLNRILAKERRLFLTRIIKREKLSAFHVADIDQDLEESGRWKIKEPIPERCSPIDSKQLDCILVPGLGFDKHCHRLGYGLGHYDRLLSSLNCCTYGIGFKEQLLSAPLPIEPHDISLTEIILF